LAPTGIWDDPVIELEERGALVHVATPERAGRVMAGLWKYKTMIEEVSRGPKT
jgi:hypothetical protein